MRVKITGNTYDNRETLTRLGGKWNAEEKAWYVTIPEWATYRNPGTTRGWKLSQEKGIEFLIGHGMTVEILGEAE